VCAPVAMKYVDQLGPNPFQQIKRLSFATQNFFENRTSFLQISCKKLSLVVRLMVGDLLQ
jgi:hypothetical protein